MMKKTVRDKLTFALSVCAGCLLALLLLRSPDFDPQHQHGIYTAHAESGETLPPAQGRSYYEHQWALKNNGLIRRITSVYRHDSSQGESGQTAPDSGFGGGPGVTGPGSGDGESGPGAGLPDSAAPEAKQEVYKQITDSVAGVDMGMEKAWAFYEQLPQRRIVTVAIIDTGVDTSHEELAASIWVNEDEIPGDGIDNDNNGYIDDVNGWNFYSGTNQVFVGEEDDHGTHGAGTVAAAWDGQGIVGIADSSYVKIMVLKVLGSQEGVGVSSNVKSAIRYAQANGADICSLSMGTLTYDGEMDRLISDSPMLFVVSAGNGDAAGKGYDIDALPMYPAAFSSDHIITVGNLMFDGNLDESSNYGAVSVDLAAPGTYILGAVPGNGYAYMTGTSMAAPMVTGTAALVYSCRTDFSLMDVREAILNSARKMEGLEGKVATGGMVDAYGAISYGR